MDDSDDDEEEEEEFATSEIQNAFRIMGVVVCEELLGCRSVVGKRIDNGSNSFELLSLIFQIDTTSSFIICGVS